ncbi:MAG: response regulator, partial [Lentisphaeraceae bacterium]|nr:response regulator [Lentisphaeraceae bacterium]
QPDLILLDMKMPGMDGYEATRILRGNEHFKKTPIIAITASALKDDVELIHETCDDYLAKPVNSKDLIMKLSKYLDCEVLEVSADDAPVASQLTLLELKELHCYCQERITPQIAGFLEDPTSFNMMKEVTGVLNQFVHKYPDERIIQWGRSMQNAYADFDSKEMVKICQTWNQLLEKLH